MDRFEIEALPEGQGGGEKTIGAMNEWQRRELGRKTLAFAKRCRKDPTIWAKVQARAAQIREEQERKEREYEQNACCTV